MPTFDEFPVPLPGAPSALLRRVYRRWQRRGIRWAALCEPEALISAPPPRIEVIVEPRDLDAASREVDEELGGGWYTIERRRTRRAAHYLVVGPSEPIAFVRLDVRTAVEREGRFVASAAFVLAGRERQPGGWVAGEGFRSATRLLDLALTGTAPASAETLAIRTAARAAAPGFRAALDHAVGPELGSALQEMCVAESMDGVVRLAPIVRRSARRVRRGPGEWLRSIAHVLRDLVLPRRGTLVVLVGPDGSGKTTVATALLERLGSALFERGRYLRKTVGLLPRHGTVKQVMNRILRGSGVPAGPPAGTRHSAMVRPQPTLRSMLYPTYQALDMLLSRLWIRVQRARGELLVFDRYFYDCYLQSGSRNVPRWFLDLLSHLVPTPDLAIYVERDAAEIYARKPELTYEELKRQQQAVRRFLSGKEFACILDGRAGEAATTEQAVRAVVSRHLGKRRPASTTTPADGRPQASPRTSTFEPR